MKEKNNTKEKRGLLKNYDKIVTVATVAGVSLGLGASLALWRPVHDAEGIHRKDMLKYEQVKEPFVNEYGNDIQKAIQTLTNKNVEIDELNSALDSTVSSRVLAEAQQESKVREKINDQKAEATVQAAILTLLTATVGAAVGQGIGKGVSTTVRTVNNAKDAIKNFSLKNKFKSKKKDENDNDINNFFEDQSNEIDELER